MSTSFVKYNFDIIKIIFFATSSITERFEKMFKTYFCDSFRHTPKMCFFLRDNGPRTAGARTKKHDSYSRSA